jgi:hypothetical protein
MTHSGGWMNIYTKKMNGIERKILTFACRVVILNIQNESFLPFHGRKVAAGKFCGHVSKEPSRAGGHEKDSDPGNAPPFSRMLPCWERSALNGLSSEKT